MVYADNITCEKMETNSTVHHITISLQLNVCRDMEC